MPTSSFRHRKQYLRMNECAKTVRRSVTDLQAKVFNTSSMPVSCQGRPPRQGQATLEQGRGLDQGHFG